jgi:hypothetical protein
VSQKGLRATLKMAVFNPRFCYLAIALALF